MADTMEEMCADSIDAFDRISVSTVHVREIARLLAGLAIDLGAGRHRDRLDFLTDALFAETKKVEEALPLIPFQPDPSFSEAAPIAEA